MNSAAPTVIPVPCASAQGPSLPSSTPGQPIKVLLDNLPDGSFWA